MMAEFQISDELVKERNGNGKHVYNPYRVKASYSEGEDPSTDILNDLWSSGEGIARFPTFFSLSCHDVCSGRWEIGSGTGEERGLMLPISRHVS